MAKPNTMLSVPEVICFSFEGIIAKTDSALLEAAQVVCKTFRLSFDKTDLTIGETIKILVSRLAREQHADLLESELDSVVELFGRHYIEALTRKDAPLLNTAILALTEAARNRTIAAALVSLHLRESDLLTVIQRLNIVHKFDAVVGVAHQTNSGLEQEKHPPHQPFMEAVQRLGSEPQLCSGLGQTPFAVTMMAEAGMCPLAVKVNASGIDLGRAGASRIFAGPESLNPHIIIDAYRAWLHDCNKPGRREQHHWNYMPINASRRRAGA